MTIDDIRMEHGVRALGMMMRFVHARKTEQRGEGSFECPACQKTFRFAFTRTPSRQRRIAMTYAGKCETEGCLELRGH